jgi:deoxyribodipyrimidine photolyase-related protein
LTDFDAQQDAVWMAEVDEESKHVPSAKQRITVFLSAMRHFATELRTRGIQVLYRQIDEPDNPGTLAQALAQTIELSRPNKLIMTEPGDWRVLQALR